MLTSAEDLVSIKVHLKTNLIDTLIKIKIHKEDTVEKIFVEIQK
jgi:hypothetical protein